METLVTILVYLLELYAVAGVVFSIILILKGLKSIDSGVEGTSIWFKLLIFPGLCAFWPLFFMKWRNSSKS
jgi:hypothetical protein